jgi:two-component system, NarL family, sensor kinase
MIGSSVNVYQWLEVVLYALFLTTTGLLFRALIQANQNQRKYLQIIHTKHKINLDLAACEDWDSLIDQIVKIPSRIAFVQRSCLYMKDPINNGFDEVAHWGSSILSKGHCGGEGCKACSGQQIQGEYAFTACALAESGSRNYCLPLGSGLKVIGLLNFEVAAEHPLNATQMLLFENIGDEIAVALRVGQERQVMQKINDAEISLHERRKVTYFLHDNLAQNIGYLRLKLDQILREKNLLDVNLLESDLKSLLEVSNQSFETIRGILETLTPQSKPGFSNILHELARKVGQRARLEVSFHTAGQERELPVETSQALVYAFQEILNNIEKHAHATQVDILIEWKEEEIVVCLSDNGVGFNPERVDSKRHFGLGILSERIAAVNGTIEINSQEMVGTKVILSTPLRHYQYSR